MVMVRERGLCVAVCYSRLCLALICVVRAVYTSVGTRCTLYEQLLLDRALIISVTHIVWLFALNLLYK